MCMPRKKFQFVLKPSLACNLACKYCYATQMRHDKKYALSLDEVLKAIDWAVEFSQFYGIKEISFLWQGGEPLMVGPRFLDVACSHCSDICKKAEIKTYNILQSNLLLMDESFLPVVKSHFDYQIGFSYDYLSSTRVWKNGENAERAIWEKALCCKEQGLSIGAICQITKTNINYIFDLYKKFNDAGIHFKVSQIFPSQNIVSEDAVGIPAKESAVAICKLFDIWFADKESNIEITNLKEMAAALLRGHSNECSRQKNCAELLLSILPGGRIMPCARFDNNSDVIGNFYQDSPKTVFENRLALMKDSFDRLTECDVCRYKNLCFGGCYYNRLTGWHESECISNKIIFEHIERRLAEKGLKMGCMSSR